MSSGKGYGLLSSIAGKAQGFLAGSTGAAEGQPTPHGQAQGQHPAPVQEQSGTLSGRHHGLEALSHQIRSAKAHYTSGVSQENRQLQLVITAQKGVSLDFDAAGRDAKTHSKELYLWGQQQDDGMKDVTDRLAYLNYVQGALSYTLATEIEKSRAEWKHVRDAEAGLVPRRTIQQNFKNEISRIRAGQASNGRAGNLDAKLHQLEEQLKKAETDDAPLERELDLLKRAAIKESEAVKWKAFRDYANKLVLLTGAAEQLLNVLPSVPGPYHGQQQTAAVRAALQRALDSGYAPPTEHLPVNIGTVSVDDKKSFGETHAHELSQISAAANSGHHDADSRPQTPNLPTPTHSDAHPIKPAALNNAPASIPPPTMNTNTNTNTYTYSPPATSPPPLASQPKHYTPPADAPKSYAPPSATPPGEPNPYTAPVAVPSSHNDAPRAPTVAETGVPISAGVEGPGPVHGSLAHSGEKDQTVPRPEVGYGVGTGEVESLPPTYVNPAAGSQDVNLQASGSIKRPVETHHETAEEEKKRLEREEREKVLRADTLDSEAALGDTPPAYKD